MTYVLSDIHGQKRRWESILQQIDLQPEDTLYVLGDVIDRYPDGIQILRQIMSMPNVKMLIGNHELMMLKALYYPVPEDDEFPEETMHRRLTQWYHNGGNVTHQYLKRIRKTTRAEIFRYLDKLPYNIEIEVNGKKYILTHAAVPDGSPHKYATDREYAVWHRYNHFPERKDRTVIFGHTTTVQYQNVEPISILYREGWIGIDCGCSYPEGGAIFTGTVGRLACLRLDDMKEFYSEEPVLETYMRYLSVMRSR